MSQVVFITGTSTGFGRATAETLSRRGYNVIATMRGVAGKNAANAEALRALAAGEKLALQVLELDVTDDSSVNRAVEDALAQAGRIDVVINNAGVAALGITEAFPVEQFQALFNINLFGAVRVNRAVLPAMRRQRGGLLIHVSSAAGRTVVPCMAAYCASKFALEALADAYRFDLSPFGIDSVIVEPGIHRTPILEATAPAADQARLREYGAAAEYAARVKSVFDRASASPETPDEQLVVDAFVRLIETPAGERPLRTIPTPRLDSLLDPYNTAADQVRQGIAHMFRVPELLTLQQSAPAGG